MMKVKTILVIKVICLHLVPNKNDLNVPILSRVVLKN